MNSPSCGGRIRGGCASVRAWTVSPRWSKVALLCRRFRRSTIHSIIRDPRRPPRSRAAGVPAYFIGGFYDRKSNGDTLKDVLREYGVSMTGNKAKLLQKLAALAARQYSERRSKMDAFFSEHRFVRINATPPRSERLPLLEDEPLLRNLLLTMYAMKHLRGNAILDVAHDNNTYTEEQLAHALLLGKVGFSGAFLRVA